MRLKVVSEDTTLLATCRDVLADFEDSGWELIPGNRNDVSPADFCIWDFQPGMPLPERADWESRHVFLVSRSDLEAFGESSVPGASVLMKPVTRPALAAFFARKASAFCEKGTPVDQLLQCLIETNGRLEETDDGHSNFVSRAIHDCLTPVTAIGGYARLLALQQFGSTTDRQAELLGRIQHSAERLSRLMGALLQLATPGGAGAPSRKTSDMNQCIEAAVRELASHAKERLIRFDVKCEPAPEALLFDRAEMEQVLIHLIENACRFTPRQGAVEVRGYEVHWEAVQGPPQRTGPESGVRQTANAFRVDVGDSGPGISSENQQELFREFKSYNGGQDRSGAGLGLAIARMLVERHGGCIWAESNSTAGTVFSFVLPFEWATSKAQVEGRDR
jgi:signal transduction histidine kinase